MDNKANILNKIEALFSKTTTNGCTEEEMNSALDLANRLLKKYNLDMNELFTRDKSKVEFEVKESHPSGDYSDLPQWKFDIARAVAKLYDCRLLIIRGTGNQVGFVGLEVDISIARVIFDNIDPLIASLHLFARAEKMTRLKMEGKRATIKASQVDFLSFAVGISRGLVERINKLIQLRETNQIEGLIIHKAAVVDKYMTRYTGRFNARSGNGRVLNNNDVSSGKSYSNQISISPNAGGSAFKQLS